MLKITVEITTDHPGGVHAVGIDLLQDRILDAARALGFKEGYGIRCTLEKHRAEDDSGGRRTLGGETHTKLHGPPQVCNPAPSGNVRGSLRLARDADNLS